MIAKRSDLTYGNSMATAVDQEIGLLNKQKNTGVENKHQFGELAQNRLSGDASDRIQDRIYRYDTKENENSHESQENCANRLRKARQDKGIAERDVHATSGV